MPLAGGRLQARHEDVGVRIEVPLVPPPSAGLPVLLGLGPRGRLSGIELRIEMARRKQQPRAVGREPAAGGPTPAGADPHRHGGPRRRRVEGLHENLVERIVGRHRLIADPPRVWRKVSLACLWHADGDLHRRCQELPFNG
jgi:hypothetical protein